MTGEKKKKEIFYFYGSLVLITFLISIAGLLYHNGYRIEAFHLAKTGSLEVAVYESGSQIYIDNVLQKTTSESEETLTFPKLSPNNHILTIENEGFQTLQENINIASEQTLKVSTFLLPTQIKLEKITGPEEEKAVFLFAQNTTPTISEKRTFQNSSVWADGKSVYALWAGDANSIPSYLCVEVSPCKIAPVLIFTASDPITNVDFYKDREDVLIVSYATHIDVIEMNAYAGQNVHHLFGGTSLTFYKESNDVLYIEDGKDIRKMQL